MGSEEKTRQGWRVVGVQPPGYWSGVIPNVGFASTFVRWSTYKKIKDEIENCNIKPLGYRHIKE